MGLGSGKKGDLMMKNMVVCFMEYFLNLGEIAEGKLSLNITNCVFFIGAIAIGFALGKLL